MPLSITPVYDRVQSDIDNRTSKGFFNAADFNRIGANAEETHTLLENLFGSFAFSPYSSVTVEDHGNVDDLNSVIQGIEDMRAFLASIDAYISLNTSTLKTDWLAGPDKLAFNFRHVNDWERYTEILYNRMENYVLARKARTGVAGAGRGLTRNNSFRG